MNQTNPASARIVTNTTTAWEPSSGSELERLLAAKFPETLAARQEVRASSLSILRRCIDPNNPLQRSNTGLIVGYVQSGKTLSFTSVAAAARDNGYRAILVIAGASLTLADQNKDRLASDLGVGNFTRPWFRKHNPTLEALPSMQAALTGWDQGRGKTLLLTALKHHVHVRNLNRVVEALGDAASPMLIIDDEADQISLNARVNDGGETANYSQILDLRARAPRHTYLQYTATPQANIFIPLWDRLSPSFGEVLRPGNGYVGGKRFFVERQDDLITIISDDDLRRADTLSEPPRSLHFAMQVFFLGVAQGLLEFRRSGQAPDPLNRSMMVHPSRAQLSHQAFAAWVQTAKQSWERLLRNNSDPDRAALVASFRAAYDDLTRSDTTGTLAEFDVLMADMPDCIGGTQVREVNRRRGVDRVDWPSEWGQAYAWILVGGQNLDRGFTVEGLTVSYMPRDIGNGQADTIQQRARFFGYKRTYEDLCRIFLGPDARRAFDVYVRHEQGMRRFIEKHKDNLADPNLPRQFELDPLLRPTRPQVLVDDPTRYVFRSGWIEQQSPMDHVARCRRNGEHARAVAQRFGTVRRLDSAAWISDPSNLRADHLHEGLIGVPLQDLYLQLLLDIVLPNSDEHRKWQVALEMIAIALEQAEQQNGGGPLLASLIFMRPLSHPFRSLDGTRAIKELFAGAYPGVPPYAYRGDREVHASDVTLQVHLLDLGIAADADTGQERVIEERQVPIVALWLGQRVNRPMIRQEPVVA